MSHRSTERRMTRRRRKTILLGAVLIAEVAAIGVQGTFATYNSRLVDLGSSVSAGTLVLATTTGGSACDSWTGSATQNVNSSCGTIPISVPVAGNYFYPGQSATSRLAVQNAGTLSAPDLSVYASSECEPTVFDASPTPTVCDAAQFFVQETGAPVAVSGVSVTAGSATASVASGGFSGVSVGMEISGAAIPAGTTVSAHTTGANSLTMSQPALSSPPAESVSFATPTICWYPLSTLSTGSVTTTAGSASVSVASGGFSGVSAGMYVTGIGIPSGTTVSSYTTGANTLTMSSAANASQSASATLSFTTTTCSFALTQITSASQFDGPGTLTDFTYNDFFASNARLYLGPIGAGATRYFLLGFLLPTASSPSLGDDYQGSGGSAAATFDLTWHLDEQAQPGDLQAP